MPSKIKILLILFLYTQISVGQNITINGYVKDHSSGEVLIGANILLKNNQIGTSTNEYGHYSLEIPSGKNTLIFSYVGFNNIEKTILTTIDTMIYIELINNTLQEITVTAKSKSVASQGLNRLNIPIQQLARMPSIGGETDIMKALSFFPGISIGQEGTSSLYIRGGTPDQNLILLDGIPVYNSSHIGGFFSVFNADAINNIDIIRGGMPPQYGGRLSSVIDITMREGNTKEFKGSVGLGILTSHLLLEGPFKNKKGSYLFASRVSYLGLINLFKEKKKSDYYFDYWLYDLNFKTNFQLKKGKLYFSFYNNNDTGDILSRDINYLKDTINYKYETNDKIRWGNTTISARYSLPISSKLFAKFLIGYTAYRYRLDHFNEETFFTPLGELTSNSSFGNSSNVRDWIGRIDFDYNLNSKHYIKYGLGATFHLFSTASSVVALDEKRANSSYQLNEYFGYLQDKIDLTEKFSTSIGLRWEGFQTVEKFYQKLEPRLSIQYQLSKKNSLTASFAQTQQYIHLLQNNGFGLPNDIWVPATDNIPPQTAYQATLGNSFSFTDKLSLATEIYYKKTSNVIEYKTGLDEDIYNQIGEWEQLVESGGVGESYGLESLLQKDYGKFQGYLAYTLSWNYRQFKNINEGKRYPFTYDRRHDFAIVLRYSLSKKVTLTGNWIYQTGTAVTLPIASAPFPESFGGDFITLSGGIEIPFRREYFIYEGKNNRRLPAYHRTDIGMEYKRMTKRKRTLIWKFSIYNLFNRRNPSYLYLTGGGYKYQSSKGLTIYDSEVKQASLFTIIPGVSLDYKF